MSLIIPAIDIINGQCVRLTEGDYATQKVYFTNPLDAALYFEDCGCTRLHLVDLDGAKAGRVINYPVLRQIAEKTKLVIDFGGGVKTDVELQRVIDCGAVMVTAGSIAVKDEKLVERWLAQYGDKIILGADVRNGQIAVSGWRENSGIELFGFLEKYLKKGVKKVICTDISRDGSLNGPAIDLYAQIMLRFPQIELIASGGISSAADIDDLAPLKLAGVIVGKAIYENRIDCPSLERLTGKSGCR